MTCSGEASPVGDIKVGLLKGGVTNNVIYRAEPDTKTNRAGFFLFNENIDIAVAILLAGSGGHLNVIKVVHVLKALASSFHFNRVEVLTGLHRKLTANHSILSFVITLDGYFTDKETAAFDDAVGDGDAGCRDITNVGPYGGISISA